MAPIHVVEEQIRRFLTAIRGAGFLPRRVILFGSYAKGNAHTDSDIDLAVWADGFEGARVIDVPKVARAISLFPSLELHPFAPDDTAATNPFIREIELTGLDYSGLIDQ